MTASPAPDTLSVPGPDALPALVPHLVGFMPHSSLVLLGLVGRRVRLTVRVDLPPRDEPVDRYLRDVQGTLAAFVRSAAGTALLVLYPPDDESPWRTSVPVDLPRRALVTELEAALEQAGVRLSDAVCVVGDRIRSYLCDDPVCCPLEGHVVDPSESLRIQAAMVVSGSAPRATRDDLVASLDARADDDPFVVDVEEARVTLADCEALLSVADVEHFRDGVAVWGASGDPMLLPSLVALVTALCQRIRPRDLLLLALVDEPDRAGLERIRAVLTEAVRCAVPVEMAPVASVLGVASWLLGDGATARVALVRALAADPGYSLAALVTTALDHGLPPESWAEHMRGLSVEAVLRATAPDYPPGVDDLDEVDELLDAYEGYEAELEGEDEGEDDACSRLEAADAERSGRGADRAS